MSLLNRLQNSSLARSVARSLLRWAGWRIEMQDPGTSRYIVIGYPHTSNWDFMVTLLFMIAEKVPIRLVGKASLFRGPVGVVMRSVNAIPVDRSKRHNFVDQVAELFRQHDELVIGIAPEGTRGKSHRWRTGFYYMALKAQVPVVLAFLDYGNKVCGFGPSFVPSGDIEADFNLIRAFYRDIQGKNPNQQGEIVLPPRRSSKRTPTALREDASRDPIDRVVSAR
jgi:1-acyl-sn-glycerol-3-phosphate acyltransferase